MEWTIHYHDGIEFWACDSGTPVEIMRRIITLHEQGIKVYPMDPREWYGARPNCDWIADY